MILRFRKKTERLTAKKQLKSGWVIGCVNLTLSVLQEKE